MPLSNTQILINMLGWDSGSVHQVADKMNVSVNEILDADWEKMKELVSIAKEIRGTKQFLQD